MKIAQTLMDRQRWDNWTNYKFSDPTKSREYEKLIFSVGFRKDSRTKVKRFGRRRKETRFYRIKDDEKNIRGG